MTTLKYYWVATYEDGTIHPQFNPDGTENLWKGVDQNKVIKVSWCQFSRGLSKKVGISTSWALFPRKHSVEYDITDKIFICRRNHINFSVHGEKGRRIEYIIGKNDSEVMVL